MKRAAEFQIGGKAKIPKNQSAVLFAGLLEVVGTTSLDRHALEKAKLLSLKSACSHFHLNVGKSGRSKDGKQKYALKRDYIESIIAKINCVSAPADVFAGSPGDYVESITTDLNLELTPVDVRMRQSDDITASNRIVQEDKLAVNFGAPARSNPMADIPKTQPIEVKVFRSAKDYRTIAIHTSMYPYALGRGILMSDLITQLGLKGMYKLVDPLNYRTVYIREDYIDHIIVELHLKRQGYLRLIPASYK